MSRIMSTQIHKIIYVIYWILLVSTFLSEGFLLSCTLMVFRVFFCCCGLLFFHFFFVWKKPFCFSVHKPQYGLKEFSTWRSLLHHLFNMWTAVCWCDGHENRSLANPALGCQCKAKEERSFLAIGWGWFLVKWTCTAGEEVKVLAFLQDIQTFVELSRTRIF